MKFLNFYVIANHFLTKMTAKCCHCQVVATPLPFVNSSHFFYFSTKVNKGIPTLRGQSPKLKIVLRFGLSRLKCTANAGLDNFQHVLLMHKKKCNQ